MRYSKIAILSFLLFVSYSASSFSNDKILIVSSYGSDYQWSNSIIEQVSTKIKESYPSIEINIEYLSSDRFPGAKVWTDRMQLLLDNYDDIRPLAIVLISDEAWMAYQEVHNEVFENIPLFLAAVKPHCLPIHKYEQKISSITLNDMDSTQTVLKRYNATGVIRQMNVPAFIELMNKSIQNISQYTIITDSRFYGVYNRLLIEDYFHRSGSKIPVNYYDARFIKTDSLLRKLPDIPSNTGVLLTSWMNQQSGREYSQADLYKRMDSALEAPIFITNDIGLNTEHFIGGIFNEGHFWGEKTGAMVVQMLKGTPASQIPVEMYTDEQCHINWQVMHQSGLMQFSFPKDTRFVNEKVSILEEYRMWFVAASILLALMVISLFIFIKKNIALQGAKDETLRILEDLHYTNQELIATQEMLRKEVSKSKKSNFMKSAFIASMESEIRNPLSLVVGFSELISATDDQETLHEASKQIVENSQKLTKLITNILDISLIEAGNIQLTNEGINPDGLFRDMINLFNKKVNPNVSILYHPSATPTNLKSDTQRVTQILYIFMENAVKFTSQGTIETGYFETDNNEVELYVKDTGTGIIPEEQVMIFDYFYKCDPYVSGAGLGLSIAKELTRMLDGKIGVSSTPNEGSRFWIRLKKENNTSNAS